jgi:hypothetical protein
VKYRNSRMSRRNQPTWRTKKAMIWIHSARAFVETLKFSTMIE